MTLADKIAEHTASVFLNSDHFAESFTFESRNADDIPFLGIFGKAVLKSTHTDEATADLADAEVTISVETLELFQAAVSDFDQDGWINVHGTRYSIAGEMEHDHAMVTLALKAANNKTLRRINPHGPGRVTK